MMVRREMRSASQKREGDGLTRAGQLDQQREERDHVEPVAQLRDRVGGVKAPEAAVVADHGPEAAEGERGVHAGAF